MRTPLFLLPLLLVILAPRPAEAQAWHGTDWVVVCEGSPQDCEGTEGAVDYYTVTLEEASTWLRGLGFRGPSIEHDGYAYLARISDAKNADSTGHRASYGFYDGNDDRLYLTSSTYFALGRGDTQAERDSALASETEYTATVVHELFHGVQNSYPSWQQENSSSWHRHDDPVADWISEGMADAVLFSWIRHQMPEETVTGGIRSYNFPLHEPQVDIHAYHTHYFWEGVGKIIGSADDVQYLHTILEEDLGPDDGLSGVDAGLRQFDPEGLYSLYPEFIARYVDKSHFFHGGNQVVLSYDAEHEVRETARGTVREVAADAHRVVARVPEGEMASLTIEIEQDHEDLHLIVGDERLDTSGPRERNVFRTSIFSRHGVDTLLVRVANVARQAVDSEKRDYTLVFTLDPVTTCSPEMMGAATNEGGFALPVQGGTWEEMGREMGIQAGQSTLRFGGLVTDGGLACASPVSYVPPVQTAEEREPPPSDADIDRMVENAQQAADAYMDMMSTITQELFGKSLDETTDQDFENMTPEQEARMMEMMGTDREQIRELEREHRDRWREREGDVVLSIYSPNTTSWLTGMLAYPMGTRHDGVAGWLPNAAGLINLQLPRTSAADLDEGGTYDAEAFAPLSADLTPGRMPTRNAFYMRWDGTWVEDCGVPPAEMQQAAQQQARQLDPDGKWIDVADVMEPGCITGTSQFLTGSLSGTVTVETITAAEIQGTFSVSGPATLTITDAQGEREQTGSVTVEGRFSTPTVRMPVESDS